MTRKEIESYYTIDVNGLITDVDKFEAEMLYAPYFLEACGTGEVLSVMEDGVGEYAELIEIDENDRKEFPEIHKSTTYMLVKENDYGFVSCTELNNQEAQYWREEYARTYEEE